jgi:serine/threonine protein kinase
MIMEYFEGQTLEDFIQKNGPLETNHAIEVFTQIAKSIEGLHELGIAHRDIKPENILINENMEIKLIDFNISKACASHEPFNTESLKRFRSVYHSQVSSPLYCAPELKNSLSYTESIDIWGLGVLLFTMLLGNFKSFELGQIKDTSKR